MRRIVRALAGVGLLLVAGGCGGRTVGTEEPPVGDEGDARAMEPSDGVIGVPPEQEGEALVALLYSGRPETTAEQVLDCDVRGGPQRTPENFPQMVSAQYLDEVALETDLVELLLSADVCPVVGRCEERYQWTGRDLAGLESVVGAEQRFVAFQNGRCTTAHFFARDIPVAIVKSDGSGPYVHLSLPPIFVGFDAYLPPCDVEEAVDVCTGQTAAPRLPTDL